MPATVTGLAPDPQQPGYRLVELDRGFFASLPEDAVGGIAVGDVLTPPLQQRLDALADVEAAYRTAVALLTRRGLARADLARRLAVRQHPPGAVAAALERLTAQGLLDDRLFAERFAATHGARGRGPLRLINDLQHRGVERALAEQAVRSALAAEHIDPEGEVRRLAERRARALAGLPVVARRRRLVGFLARRGYRGAEVRELVERLVPRG